MWPWSRRSGIVTSALLLVVLVGTTVVVSAASTWPSDELEPWVFVAAILLALVPVAMLLVDFAAQHRATVGIARVFSVDFSAATTREQPQAPPITPNIVGAGVAVGDSGNTQMRAALESATDNDVVEVDLGGGESWWPTRLLVLTAGAARLGRPAAIAFVALDGGQPRTFQGWSRPAALLERLLQRDPELRLAFWRARKAWQNEQSLPVPPYSPSWEEVPVPTDSPLSIADANRVPVTLAPEMALADELVALEPPQHGLSIVDLAAIAGPVLHRDTVELCEPIERQLDVALAADGEFVGVLDRGRYTGLARVDTVARSVVRSVADAFTTGAATTGAAPR